MNTSHAVLIAAAIIAGAVIAEDVLNVPAYSFQWEKQTATAFVTNEKTGAVDYCEIHDGKEGGRCWPLWRATGDTSKAYNDGRFRK